MIFDFGVFYGIVGVSDRWGIWKVDKIFESRIKAQNYIDTYLIDLKDLCYQYKIVPLKE